MTITFYDIPSNLPRGPYSPSPNTWKIRYALNYKNIPYTTVWVEYPDIKALYEKLSLSASAFEADGSPFYTLPLIQDASTGTFISESSAIAHYLDATYPDTPSLFPLGPNSYALHKAFSNVFQSKLGNLWQFALPAMYEKLNPRSQAYFKPSKEAKLGSSFEQLARTVGEKEWEKVKEDLATVGSWIDASKGIYVTGDTISFADIEVVSFILWLRVIFGVDSQKWKDVETWEGGRWGKLVKALEKYEVVRV